MRSYGMSDEQQDAVWVGFHAGESINSIAKAQLLPSHHVRRYLGQTGGIRPAPLGRSAGQLSAAKRDELSGSAMRFAARPTGPQRPGQFAAQLPASLHVEGLIDGLVHQVPFPLAGNSVGSAWLICSGLQRSFNLPCT